MTDKPPVTPEQALLQKIANHIDCGMVSEARLIIADALESSASVAPRLMARCAGVRSVYLEKVSQSIEKDRRALSRRSTWHPAALRCFGERRFAA